MPKCQFYEVVRIVSENPELAEIAGQAGPILGIGEGDDGTYSYGVLIESDGHVWQVEERDLAATGEMRSRSDYYDEARIRVRVDETGRGWVSE